MDGASILVLLEIDPLNAQGAHSFKGRLLRDFYYLLQLGGLFPLEIGLEESNTWRLTIDLGVG